MGYSNGDHGRPTYNNTPDTLRDLQAASDYAALIGNRVIVNNNAELTTGFGAKFGSPPWDGLEAFNLDSGDVNIYNASTGQWEDAYASPDAQTSGVATLNSGWSYSGGGSQTMIVARGEAQIYLSFFRTGGTINVPADGNVTNVVIGTLSLPPKMFTVGQSGTNGRLAHFGIGTNGQISLSAVTPGTNITTGDGFSCGTGKFFI